MAIISYEYRHPALLPDAQASSYVFKFIVLKNIYELKDILEVFTIPWCEYLILKLVVYFPSYEFYDVDIRLVVQLRFLSDLIKVED